MYGSLTVTGVQFHQNGIYSEENPSIQTTFTVAVRDQFGRLIPGARIYFKDDVSEVSFVQSRQTDSEGVVSFKYSYGIEEGKTTADYNAVFSTGSGFAAGDVTAQQDIHLVLQRKADLVLYQNQIIGTTPGENNGKVIDVPDNYEIWTGEVHQGAIVIGSGEWQRSLNGEFTGLSAGQHILRAGESVNEETHTFYFASDYADFFIPRGLWKVAVDVSASAHVSFPQGTELTAEPGVDLFLYAEPEAGFRISSYSVDKPGRIGGLAYDEDNGFVSAGNILDLIKDYDFILDGTDNFPAKFLINDACVLAEKPFSHAGIIRFQGQLMTYVPGQGPCYRCVFKQPPPKDAVPTCSQAGVVGAMGGVIGSLQAMEAIKYITGAGDLLVGHLLTYDALKMEFRKIKLPWNGGHLHQEITRLVDYEQKECGGS